MARAQTAQFLVRRLTAVSLAVAAVSLALIGLLAWWTVSKIDERALSRQESLLRIALKEAAEQLPKEQDSSAVWDDAVLNARANNGAWLAENLVEWMSSYYGHDRVYVLDPTGNPLRSASNGHLAPNSIYAADEPAIAPLVARLRSKMNDASTGETDSTSSVTGMGEADYIRLPNNGAALASVRPILPSSDRVQQAPGTEFLHVAIQMLDASFTSAIGSKFAIEDLSFSTGASASSGKFSNPVNNAAGDVVGFLTWTVDRPGSKLISDMAPALSLGSILAFIGGWYLLWRLRRTSAELHLSEAHAQFLAFHDPLTRIPNRALFEDRLERALANMRRTNAPVALHYLDLDRFKHVNDTLGHPAGDELVRQVAHRLTSVIREVDTVARLGGDEFAIIQIDASDEGAAEALCERMLRELDAPFDLTGDEARIGASIGVVVSKDPETTPQDMMRKADIALYEAKANGRGRHQVFAGDLDDAVRERRALERDLRTALQDRTGIFLEYQPLYGAKSRQLIGAEALARWMHPTKGAIPPSLFIGVAEERGLIEQLGSWVLREACEFAASHDIPWVAVNVSPVQFRDEHFADRVLAVLSATGLAANRLELEITEGLLLQNSPNVQTTLRRLRSAGIRVALDDFGTGYSSISYLRTYGVDKLKIDKSFVEQLGWDEEINSIIKGIIDLARAMKMQVTAEGVETELQELLLVEMGCDELQGYLLSMPLCQADLCALLADKPSAVHQPAS